MATALIGLGSNLGDREGWLRLALDRLDAHQRVSVIGFSSLFESAAMGGPSGQGPFLNACATLDTDLLPHELLRLMLDIERVAGRVRTVKNAPRTLDLDVLLYDAVVCDDPGLTIPHPGMLERAFVTVPAADVAPDLVHPKSSRTLADHAIGGTESGGVTLFASDWWGSAEPGELR